MLKMLKAIKSIDSKLADLLIAFFRAIAGIFFYDSIFYLAVTVAIETNDVFANWFASLLLDEYGETSLLVPLLGIGLCSLSAMLYLLIPIRHFGILLSPLIVFIGTPLFIIAFL
jgi:hypothetical protein